MNIKASTLGGAKLTYSSDNKSVKVNAGGKITIVKNFTGKAVITITAAETAKYKRISAKITVTVRPIGTSLTKLTNNAKGKHFQITDPKLYAYGVERPMNAIENLTATTLRNIIGEMELDQSLTSRDTINAKMRAILDEATDPWGITPYHSLRITSQCVPVMNSTMSTTSSSELLRR